MLALVSEAGCVSELRPATISELGAAECGGYSCALTETRLLREGVSERRVLRREAVIVERVERRVKTG